MVGNKKFKVRGLRLGAYDYIVDKLLIRDIINPDTAKKEMIAIMKNDASIPYKVAAAGVLNNYWFFEIIPFARRIYAWWLSRHYDHKELTPLIEAIVEGANVSDFFTNTIRLAFLIATTATLRKKDDLKISLSIQRGFMTIGRIEDKQGRGFAMEIFMELYTGSNNGPT